MPIDYPTARATLDETLVDVAQQFLSGQPPPAVDARFAKNADALFASNTQAFREVLLGCILVRLQDKSIDVTKPYVNQGGRAYSGRTLDERAVNPFFHDHRIPSSKGPFLSVFRRSVTFTPETRGGVRDKDAFDAFIRCLAIVRRDGGDHEKLLRYMLYRFVELREASSVPLTRIQRFSLAQYEALIRRLLDAPSGGRFPVFLIVAAFRSISQHFELGWEISSQGINVADSPSGAGGDVTIRTDGTLLLAAEVTERPVGRDRVVSTFNTKIAPAGMEDYLFFVSQEPMGPAVQQADRYFAQGHEVSFVDISRWLTMMLATVGKRGREAFTRQILAMLDDQQTPQSVRAAWNDAASAVIDNQQN